MDWPHAPVHRLGQQGAFIVTAGTYKKACFFNTPKRLSLLRDMLLESADQYGWRLQAWAVFNNHYHFVALSPENAESLKTMISKLHTLTGFKTDRVKVIDDF
jgi:putative transposase